MSVRRSLVWTYGGQALTFVITFATSVIVARLVSPRDFGIYAMASAASAIINIFFAFSLGVYIIREKEVDTPLLRSAFTVNCALTVVLSVLIYGAGWAATLSFESPEVGEFLRLFALTPLIGMFEFIPNAVCARGMRFRVLNSIGLLRIATLSGLTIVFAKAGFEHMSFAWATLGSALLSMILYNILEWRPSVWRPSFTNFRRIVTFGLQMMSISGLNQMSSRAGDLMLGSILGLRPLGLYSRASNLGLQIYNNVYGIGASVIFSKLSRDLRETGQFHQTFLRALTILLAVVWPMMIGLAILAQPVIHILYGEQWQAAALPLSLLMISFFISLGVGMNWEVFVLREETKLQTRIEVVRSTTGFILFGLGCLISLPVAAAAKIVESSVSYMLYRRHMDRLIGAGPGELLNVYRRSAALTAVATVPAFGLMCVTRFSPDTSIAAMVVAVALGVAAWATLLVRMDHPLVDELRRARELVGSKIGGRARA